MCDCCHGYICAYIHTYLMRTSPERVHRGLRVHRRLCSASCWQPCWHQGSAHIQHTYSVFTPCMYVHIKPTNTVILYALMYSKSLWSLYKTTQAPWPKWYGSSHIITWCTDMSTAARYKGPRSKHSQVRKSKTDNKRGTYIPHCRWQLRCSVTTNTVLHL